MANEKRLIDANALIPKRIWVETTHGERGYVIDFNDLSNAPTVDAVEVVRCKDCEYSACNPINLTYACGHPSGLRGFVNEGFYFCSHGERRDGE